jgi:hypothetical protein
VRRTKELGERFAERRHPVRGKEALDDQETNEIS